MNDSPQYAEFTAGHVQLEEVRSQLEKAHALMASLLKHLAVDRGLCRGALCRAPIIWVRHANGKLTPYDPDGTNHYATCPNRDQFNRKKENRATTESK